MGNRLFKVLMLGTALCATIATTGVAQGLAGPYLAGNRAILDGEFDAAGPYFVKAMTADTSNLFLKQSAVISFVSAGDFDVAASIAKVIPANADTNIFADLVSMVDLANKGDFTAAQTRLPETDAELSAILWGLLDAWMKIGAGETDAGLDAFDAMISSDTVALFGQYHKGIAQAYLGNFEAAAEILNGTEGPLHLNRDSIIAHVQILSELGLPDDAVQVLDDAHARGFNDEQLVALRAEVAEGDEINFDRADAPTYGMAEAFLTMADALSRNEPNRTALFYARLAQELRPGYVDAAMTVAEILEQEDQYMLASEAYASVPKSSISYIDAATGRAEVMRRSGDIEQATEILVALADAYPTDVVTLNALGDIYRTNKNFEGAATAYTRAIDSIDALDTRHWVLFYARGISHERLDNWPAAEEDFREALALSPDQPFVLNYLGYSLTRLFGDGMPTRSSRS
ncbi:MAG: tetratricopeptide repeat protein [Alphaproteobacteria bacterium]